MDPSCGVWHRNNTMLHVISIADSISISLSSTLNIQWFSCWWTVLCEGAILYQQQNNNWSFITWHTRIMYYRPMPCQWTIYQYYLHPFVHRQCCSFRSITLYYITCSAVALSRVLRTALVPYGNMETSTPQCSETSQVITMKLCKFDYVHETNTRAKFGWNPHTRSRTTHTWNIHFLWLLPALLPLFLAHLHRPNG